jgi:hypothetical protein
MVTANNARKMRAQNAAAAAAVGLPASHPLNNNNNNQKYMLNFSANGAPKMMNQPAKKTGGMFRGFGRSLMGFSSAGANSKLKRFANAKGITNVRAYNRTTTGRNNLMNKNRVLFFNKANKKPVLAFVPMKLRDSNISAIGKILGREYVYQPNGPMGPGHYNKQFVSQLAVVPGGPVVPSPGPIVPSPGPIVPSGPVFPGGGSGNNNNNRRRRCAELMREKARIEQQLRALRCDSKNGM